MRRPGAASHILKGGPDVSSACAKCPPASLTLRGPPDGKPLNIGLRDVNGGCYISLRRRVEVLWNPRACCAPANRRELKLQLLLIDI